MSDELYNASYDLWKTDCDEYEHCIFPADEQEPYSGYDDDHFSSTEIVVESYRPLSAKYTY